MQTSLWAVCIMPLEPVYCGDMAGQGNEKVFTTAHGTFTMDTQSDAKISGVFSGDHYHHQETLDLLPYLAARGGTIVDVGAHVGTLAIPFAQYASKVIAFEPTPATFGFLQKNIALNTAPVDARNKGLGAALGRAASVVLHDFSAAANTLSVGEGDIEISTLDAEVPAADFVKIDVEGMELGVLQGGSRLWQESKPPILFEVNLFALRRHGTAAADLQGFLKQYGYSLYYPVQKAGRLHLAKIWSLSLFVLCIAPRSFMFGGPSAPFDVVAIPRGHALSAPLPRISAGAMLLKLIGGNLSQKIRRLLSIFAASDKLQSAR
ncbi:MAG: Methyltransferase FkbM [Candidatus Adlerbacteria bacterium]|nr:Methyltransferase FkbM [Candidatus Adlerbacteria bacterium]